VCVEATIVVNHHVPGGPVPNKAQFIEQLAQRMDGDKKQAGTALDAVLDTIYANVAKGEKVALTGFGTFEKRVRRARTARNPATGEAVRVKRTAVPAFRAGAEFKAMTTGARKVAKVPGATKTTATKTTAAKKAPASKSTAKTGPASRSAGAKSTAKKTTGKSTATKAATSKSTAKKAAKATRR
jgi:DNA-binding protein HU-beta